MNYRNIRDISERAYPDVGFWSGDVADRRSLLSIPIQFIFLMKEVCSNPSQSDSKIYFAGVRIDVRHEKSFSWGIKEEMLDSWSLSNIAFTSQIYLTSAELFVQTLCDLLRRCVRHPKGTFEDLKCTGKCCFKFKFQKTVTFHFFYFPTEDCSKKYSTVHSTAVRRYLCWSGSGWCSRGLQPSIHPSTSLEVQPPNFTWQSADHWNTLWIIVDLHVKHTVENERCEIFAWDRRFLDDLCCHRKCCRMRCDDLTFCYRWQM